MNRRIATHQITNKNRVGFHFFTSENHFNDANLSAILKQFTSIQSNWIVLTASPYRAIPEFFIRSLVDHHINPIIHFDNSLSTTINPAEYDALLLAYANWGVTHVIFFDKPNLINSWSTSDWVQQNIVDRFLDRFIPLGNLAIAHGLTPVLPPLQPGGSIWDTIFFKMVLEGLQRRQQLELLDRLNISVFGWTFGQGLNWGVGGDERNPENKAYQSKALDNHLGFRLIDWYNSICETVLQRRLPAHILQAGSENEPQEFQPMTETELQSIQMAARLARGETVINDNNLQTLLDALPDNVVSCNLLCLDPAERSIFTIHAGINNVLQASAKSTISKTLDDVDEPVNHHPFDDFVLVPSYDWGVADWHLDVIRPFIKRYRPIVGFSLNEAKYAKNIFAIGDQSQFTDDQLDELRLSGCRVERITGSGTSIATILAER